MKSLLCAVVVAWLVTLAGPAEAAAHCLCREAEYQGPSVRNLNSVVKDFGTVAFYPGPFAQLTKQTQCASACDSAAGPWISNKLDVCAAFVTSGGANLALYDSLGALPWEDIGVTTAATVGYPQSCFGTPGVIQPRYYILSLAYPAPGCTTGSTFCL